MKALIVLFALAFGGNAFACSCMGPNFTDADAEKAAASFVEGKLKLTSAEVVELKKLNEKSFLTRTQKVFLAIDKKISDSSIHQCDVGCSYGANTEYAYQLTFISNKSECTQNIIVKMMSNYLNDRFKTKIKSGKSRCK